MANEKRRELLRRLAALKVSPAEQAAYATQLLDAKNGLEVVKAAVAVLAVTPDAQARPALRTLYRYYAERDGVRDPAAYTRSAILKALRPVMAMHDVDLIVEAVTTYEFLPPSFTEEAGLLRATAIVLLNELDERLAAFFATRLLADRYTEPMSGEPALTAARVLASLGELLPLYFFVTQQRAGGHPEVMSECVRNLGDAPDEVVHEIVAQLRDSGDRAALVGLFDLLLLGEDAPRHAGFLTAYLQSAEDLDLYRYLVTVMVTSPAAAVRELLLEAVQSEGHADKVEILLDALAIGPHDAACDSLIERLSGRVGSKF